MTRKLLAEGRDFESLSVEEWRGWSELFEADVVERVTSRASVEAGKTPQSTHPEAVAAALAELRWLARAGRAVMVASKFVALLDFSVLRQPVSIAHAPQEG